MRHVILLAILAGLCACAAAPRPPAPELSEAELEAELREVLDEMIRGDMETYIAGFHEVFELMRKQRLDRPELVEQLMLYTAYSDAPRLEELGSALVSAQFQAFFALSPVDALMALVPYLDSEDPRIRRRAMSMVEEFSGLAVSDKYHSLPEFFGAGAYLRGLNGEGEDHWPCEPLVPMYRNHPLAALHTVSLAYRARADDARFREVNAELQVIRRAAQELEHQIDRLGWADEGERVAGLRQDVLDRLGALAESPHWFVRAYAAGVMSKSDQRGERSIAAPELLDKLAADDDPCVAIVAEGGLQQFDAEAQTRPSQ